MPIKQIDSSNEAYNQFTKNNGGAFNDSAWINLFGENLELYGIFDNDKKLIASFYLYKTKLFRFLTYYKTPPYTPHIGWCYKNKATNKANALGFHKNLITELTDFLDSLNGAMYTLAMPYHLTDTQPFTWKKFKTIVHYTYHIDLNLSEDQLLNNMSCDKRNSLKKAERDGIRTSLTQDYAMVEKLVSNTFSRKQKLIDEALIKKILHTFSTNENSFAFVSWLNDKPISTAFCIIDKTTCYYLLGGYDCKNKHQGAGVKCMWSAIQYAKEKKLNTFDFEGSMLPEIELFFRGFGGNLIPYYSVNKAFLPVEIALKFVKRELF